MSSNYGSDMSNDTLIAVAPLSYAQERLWFLDQLEDERSIAYVVPLAVKLDGMLDENALQAAVIKMICRHEILRTHFNMVEGEVLQIIDQEPRLGFVRNDLSSLPYQLQNEQIESLMQQEACTPFDLSQGPLIRVRLIKLRPQQHIAVLCLHHIVVDGWSLGIIVGELGEHYASLVGIPMPPMPELTIQYADYAIWQREQEETFQTELEYWKCKLEGGAQQMSLPVDRPRPAIQTCEGDRYAFELSPQLAEQLQSLSARLPGVTLFMILLAAFAIVLARASGQRDLSIGTPIANRTRSELEGLIGFFVNTLVLRVDLPDALNFIEFLAHVRDICVEAYAHQQVPFERVVHAINPERTLSHSPLFQVMFALHNVPADPKQLPGLTATVIESIHKVAQFDLSLEMRNDRGRLSGAFEYSVTLFERETIESMAEQFLLVLRQVSSNPDVELTRIKLLSESQRQRVLEDFNSTEVVFPDGVIHTFIEEQVVRTPNSVAISCDGIDITYDELNRRANQLARWLQLNGVRADSLVGVAMDRCANMVVALLAVLKAGGAYVPIDPSYPQERILFMLQDINPLVLLTQSAVLNSLPAIILQQRNCLCLDQNIDICAPFDENNLGVPINKGNLAYVIYTSGSTGLPKGAMNTHRGALNRLLSSQASYPLTVDDRMLQKTPLSFDDSMRECFWPLLIGARIIIAKPGGHKEPDYLASIILQEGITVTHFVPSMLRIFLDEADASRCTSLRQVIVGGEALPEPVMQAFFSALPNTALYNLYGPTECGPDATGWTCSPGNYGGRIPIGKPVSNTRIYILDEYREPLPIGAVGEIYIGGAQVGRGYLNRDELTSERFLLDPFKASAAYDLMYRTGDLGRWLRSGDIEYLGRSDAQVKIRGFRIELGEIEALLLEYCGVQEAAVLVKESKSGDRRLVAYVATEPGAGAITVDELRQYLRRQLPEYMVPSAVMLMPSLPLTSNGKLDRMSLPEHEFDVKAHVPAVTPTECMLVALFSQVLDVPEAAVGVNVSFFELGGHSLLAVNLRSIICREMGHSIPLASIFEVPSVRGIAALIDVA